MIYEIVLGSVCDTQFFLGPYLRLWEPSDPEETGYKCAQQRQGD